MRRQLVLWVFFSFLAGVGTAVFGPVLFDAVGRSIFTTERREVARVTSPDGLVDAVSVESDCGPLCSFEYHVSLVPKGVAAQGKAADEVFYAEYPVNPRVQWKERYLLEVGYDRARIEFFHNIAHPFAHQGEKASFDYMVEIRLAPSSQSFSYLDRNGAVSAK